MKLSNLRKNVFLKRCIQAPIILLVMITISFFMIRFAPGGPFSTDRELPPEVKLELERRYHLDKPVVIQYFYYMKQLCQGDFGPSIVYKNRSVNDIIKYSLPNSILIGMIAMSVAVVLGVFIGVITAVYVHTLKDNMIMILTILGISVPLFVIAPLLQMFFSVKLGWLPIAGYAGLSNLSFLVLPAFSLSLPFTARIARLMRSGMIETLNKKFITTAVAKGVPTWKILFFHAIPDAILPVIAYLGPATAALMTGSIVIEKIFMIPGIGREFVESALNRDYTTVMGTVIVYGTMLIFCNLVADGAVYLISPQIRAQNKI